MKRRKTNSSFSEPREKSVTQHRSRALTIVLTFLFVLSCRTVYPSLPNKMEREYHEWYFNGMMSGSAFSQGMAWIHLFHPVHQYTSAGGLFDFLTLDRISGSYHAAADQITACTLRWNPCTYNTMNYIVFLPTMAITVETYEELQVAESTGIYFEVDADGFAKFKDPPRNVVFFGIARYQRVWPQYRDNYYEVRMIRLNKDVISVWSEPYLDKEPDESHWSTITKLQDTDERKRRLTEVRERFIKNPSEFSFREVAKFQE